MVRSTNFVQCSILSFNRGNIIWPLKRLSFWLFRVTIFLARHWDLIQNIFYTWDFMHKEISLKSKKNYVMLPAALLISRFT